jgi:cytochrome c556
MHSRTLIALGLVGLALIGTVAAAEDPIAQLKQIMQDNSNLEDQAISMLSGTYHPDKAIAVMQKLQANFTLLPTLFPVGSDIAGGTPTAAAISSDLDGFKALAAAMVQRTTAAEAAAPNGQKAFALTVLAVDRTCDECHKTYDRH